MSSIPTRVLKQALEKKGFQKQDSHHHMYWLVVEGKKRHVYTRISHSGKEYGDRLLQALSKQLHLTRSELTEFANCPLSREDYVNLLFARGVLEKE